MTHDEGHQSRSHGQSGYRSLVIELSLHFIVMYLVMYAMIWTINEFYLNINNLYMTLMMVTPMAAIMMVTMRSMFPSTRINIAIGVVAVVVFLGSFFAIRTQAAVGDREFLRSMIPHHSGAILMCEQAQLRDPEIVALCRDIVRSQRQEIEQMRAILARG